MQCQWKDRGGFLYLQERMEDMEGTAWKMTGVFPGNAFRTERLGRFGYLTLTANNDRQLLSRGSSTSPNTPARGKNASGVCC